MTESQIRFLYKTRAVLYGSNISKGVKQILLGVLHTNFIFFCKSCVYHLYQQKFICIIF